MSQPSRPHARGAAKRRRRQFQVDTIEHLERLTLLAPIIPTQVATTATFVATPQVPPNTNVNLGSFTITQTPLPVSAAPYVSVSELTPISDFGNDIVRIKAGPGGDFGNGLYAISRGAGDNVTLPGTINKPGVIYRIDPATGKASIFFDLNSVLNGDASNGLNPTSTGLKNWYDIAFDPEGYFDGKPSMFVSSVSTPSPTDPTGSKNAIFRIAPDGTLMSVFIKFTAGAGAGQFARSPTSVLVPPPEQQTFLRGLIMGEGSSANNEGKAANIGTSTGYVALFFNANQFLPGTDLNDANSSTSLPKGVQTTGIYFGPQTGLTDVSTNGRYQSPVYATFSDFGTPPATGVPGQPGFSGVQGLLGDLLINPTNQQSLNFTQFPDIIGDGTPFSSKNPSAAGQGIATTGAAGVPGVDNLTLAGTPYRRFQDIAFDKYGYFSYGTTVTPGVAGALPTVGNPTYAGSLFVSDLADGLAASVPVPAGVPAAEGGGNIVIPIQAPVTTATTVTGFGAGSGLVFDPTTNAPNGVLTVTPPPTFNNGRILRITPDGKVTVFADNFNVSGAQDATSFAGSSLSITFSADGTTMWASDDDGIWQFKSVLSLAGSDTGNLIGLNDLRSLGVPYDGQNSAVAIIDTGVDALTPNFRGRVAAGKNILTNGVGNDDTTSATTNPNGHGTLVAGVVAQFVPQATLQPVNVFTANQTIAAGTNATSSQYIYNAMKYVNQNPYAKDPIRPNKVDRIIATTFAFGTNQTFDTEGTAFKKYPQVVLSLKGQLGYMKHLGIAAIAAAGQLGNPNGTAAAAGTVGDLNGMAMPAILSDTISVTGTYPFPYYPTAIDPPTGADTGVAPRPIIGSVFANTTPNASTGAS